MDQRRLADIRAGVDGSAKSSGSGYLVGPSLVLTARHVVIEACGRCGGLRGCRACRVWPRIDVRIGHPMDGATVRVGGRVCWQHPDCDLALLRVDPVPALGEVAGQPVRWGWAVGTGDLEYQGMGFPQFAEYEDRRRLVEPLAGRFNPLSRDPDGYALNQTAFPDDDPSKDTLWKGVSGAAVFSGGLLVGVVSLGDRRLAGRRLRAAAARACTDDPDFLRLVRDDTGVLAVAEPVELAGLVDTRLATASAETPGSLLAAAAEVVDFHGRDEDLETLRAWREGPVPLALTLVTGEGGQGKTRLGREFVRHSRRAGWVAGFTAKASQPLTPEKQEARAADLARRLRSSTAPALVVSDYAEAHPVFVDTLITSLVEEPMVRPVRLLLLSRTVGTWWEGLAELLGDAASLLRLDPLGDEETTRRQIYASAVSGLAGHLPRLPEPAIGKDPQEPWEVLAEQLATDPPALPARFGNALTLQMTALLDLLQLAAGAERTSHQRPEHELARHERDYLKRVAAAKGLLERGILSNATDRSRRERQAVQALDRALAGLILLGPCGAELAEAVGGLAGETSADDVTDWLRALYPPPPGESTGLGQVQPDRLAEFLLGGILTARSGTDGDRLAPLVHPTLVTEIGALTGDLDTAQSALFALVRTAAHHDFRAEVGDQTVELIATRPDPFAAAAPFLAVTPAHRGLLLEGLRRLADQDPADLTTQLWRASGLLPQTSVSLAHFSAAVTQILTELFRALASSDPDAYLPDLAMSLNNHALRLAETGQRAQAIPISDEAVRLHRELANLNRDAYLPNYVQSLTVYGYVLVENARFREAVGPLVEAFVLAQELPEYAQGIIGSIVRVLRSAHAGDPMGVAEEFRAITGEEVPDWMKES